MKKSVIALILLIILTSSFLIEVKSAQANAGTENSWETKAPMPQAGGYEAAVVNGKIYVMGGSSNFEYNPATDNWTAKKPIPTFRTDFGMAVYQNKIYVIGGMIPSSNFPNFTFTGINEVYDPAKDTWETKAPMPTNRSGIGASCVNSEIYVMGGDNYTGLAVNSYALSVTEIYDVANDSWTTGEPMLSPSYGYASVAVNNKIYFMGGYFARSLTQIYDTQKNSWAFGASLLTAVGGAAAAATSGIIAPQRIYVIGGASSDIQGISTNQVYDPQKNTWTLAEPMPTSRVGLALAVVNDTLFAIGGLLTKISGALTTNEQYTPLGYGTVLPKITVLSPVNLTYNESSVPLILSLNRQVNWIAYSLDGEMNETVTSNFIVIANLTNGAHNLVVYVNDTFGNVASQNVTFMVSVASPKSSAQPITIIAISTIAVVVIAVALVVYFKKRKH